MTHKVLLDTSIPSPLTLASFHFPFSLYFSHTDLAISVKCQASHHHRDFESAFLSAWTIHLIELAYNNQ